jgi:hemolysin III
MFLLFLYDFFPHLSIVLCAVQWGVIILGLINVAIFGPGRHKAINMSLYITLGWCGITFIPYLIENDLPLLWYILLGGIVYTIGILPFILKKKGAHFIWHFFVLGGAILQFIGIFIRLYC